MNAIGGTDLTIQTSRTGVSEADLQEEKAVEVGNIFSLGTRFSDALGLTFKTRDGTENAVIMGSYGLGCTRLMGVLVEVFADERGIVWPEEVSPYQVHLVCISGGNKDIEGEANRMYELLRENDIEVLYDDRDVRAGEKFADADLIGIPTRLVVSEKTVSAGGVEMSARKNGKTNSAVLVPDSEIIERLRKK